MPNPPTPEQERDRTMLKTTIRNIYKRCHDSVEEIGSELMDNAILTETQYYTLMDVQASFYQIALELRVVRHEMD